MVTLVHHADAEEQSTGRKSMAEHVEDRALQAKGVESQQAQYREAHVAHRRIGDQFLDVSLHPADERRVDDADHREYRDGWSPSHDGLGDHR